jgi:hypothetical protein
VNYEAAHPGAVLRLHAVQRQRKTFSSDKIRDLPQCYVIDAQSHVAASTPEEASSIGPPWPSQTMRVQDVIVVAAGSSMPDDVTFRGVVVSMQVSMGDQGEQSVIRVRDTHGPHVVQVYIDNSKMHVPIVVGMDLEFRRVSRQISKHNIYCSMTADSDVMVLGWEPPPPVPAIPDFFIDVGCSGVAKELLNTFSEARARHLSEQDMLYRWKQVPVPQTCINSLSRFKGASRDQRLGRFLCRVLYVKKATWRWECSRCPHALGDGCRCVGAAHQLKCTANIHVDDGTGTAWVNVQDP